MKSTSVLVTGASSGIGLATAQCLHAAGMRVFAGVRRFSPAPPPYQQVLLDVTDPDSISSAREQVGHAVGDAGLGALVNNAGQADIAPLECARLDRFRQVFDVNVFGVLAVTQEFLPLLRRGRGRIINLGSIGGMISIPFGGALCASKHAVEAVSDCLRLELHSSGIPVTCLQPASINSGAAEKLASRQEEILASLSVESRERYGGMLKSLIDSTVESETHGSPPEVVAAAVLEILRATVPPTRRLVGKRGHLLRFLARWCPDRLRDALLRRILLRTA